MKTVQVQNIDEYISLFPEDVQKLLEEMRAVIRKSAPKAKEAIKYAIPTFVQNGNLVHFAGYKHHISLYPAPFGVSEFKEQIAPYASGKGTLQFPLDKPLPKTLIGKVVKYWIKVDEEKAKKKIKK